MNKLKELREKQNLTQKELASKLSVGRTTVTLWERGKNKPRVTMLIKLSKVLHCSIDDLLCSFT
jgi:transcriptional regulator with XRE-family HTH domain